MDQLYQAHFGLSQAPFNLSPDPTFLYLSESHREALAQLTYGINARKGFVVLTGEVGTGKTTLIHTLMNDLDEETHTALLFNTVVSSLDLLRYVCEEFKLVEISEPRKELHDYTVMLNEFLLHSYRGGKNCVLIIDEAQNLSAEVLEGIRLLSNFETSRDKLLQILLVGQPEFAVRLNAPELRQLKQRVTLRHHLRALSLKDCQEYIARRVKIAGGDPKVFSPKALEFVQSYSGGIPRLVNILCDNALLTTFALEKSVVDPGVIAEVAEDLQLFVDSSSRVNALRRVADNQVSNRVLTNPLEAISGGGRVPPRSEIARRVQERTGQSVGIGRQAMPLPTGDSPLPWRAALNGDSSGQSRRPTDVVKLNAGAPSGNEVPKVVFESIVESLTDSMGPMASVIVREQVRKLNGNSMAFPAEKLVALIDVLSEEIFDSDVRDQFRTKMLSVANAVVHA